MGFLTRCKRPFLFGFLLQNCNTLFSFFLKKFLILFEKQQRVGFSNVSYFIKCFRGHTGISPAKYRQNKLAESATLQKGTFK